MAVLSWVGAHTCPRTSVVFDAIWASVLGAQSNRPGTMCRAVVQQGVSATNPP
jgi:hypothetical protein